MKCPLCKYEPKLKKDGNTFKGYESFDEIVVYGDTRLDYTSSRTAVGYCCLKCGVMFREVENA